MNIIKLKDVLLSPDNCTLAEDKIVMFNKYYKGKYVHCINWKYLIPLDEISYPEVSRISQLICEDYNVTADGYEGFESEIIDGYEVENPEAFDESMLEKYHWMLCSDVQSYIDLPATTNVNDVQKYIAYNEFIPSELTTDEIKKFRTWLATTILSFGVEDAKTKHMLEYYKNGMFDNTIEALNMFATSVVQVNTPGTSSCGCSQQSAFAAAQMMSVSTCDPINIYRKGIFTYMISIFGNMEFWIDFDPEFILMFKKYIDGVIKLNLSFRGSTFADDFVDCGCLPTSNTKQEMAISRLRKLSKALEYIADDNTLGHKAYINGALTDWATYLYELMEW